MQLILLCFGKVEITKDRQEYFARARIYLPAVMGLQNLATVQALLCLTQYYFRGPVRIP